MNPDIQKLINETEAFIRHSLSEEQLAIAVYLERKEKMIKYANKVKEQGDEELAKKFETMAYTFEDILAEEEVHVGQFREMLDLFNVSDTKEDEGEQEGEEDIDKLMSGNEVSAEMDLEQKIDAEESFDNILNKLNFLVEEKVDIKVKHPGILEIPEDKKFWQLPLSHYNNLIAKKGYGKIIKALTNLKTWNKNDDPKISERADKIINSLRKKHKVQENLIDDVNTKRASEAIDRLQKGDTVTLGDGQKVQVKDDKLVVIDKEGNELKKVDFNQKAMKELIFDYDGILENYNYKKTNIVKSYSIPDLDADGEHLSGQVVLYKGNGVYKWVDEEHGLEGPYSFSSARTAYEKFVQSLKNKVNNKQESLKGLLNTLKFVSEDLEIEFGDYKCFKTRNNYRIAENDKNCFNCKYVGFEGSNFKCNYLGFSRFPDREVNSQFTCDVWKKA